MKKILLSFFIMFLLGSNIYLSAQTYVGSSACQPCHSAKYNDWIASGHPYKFTVISDSLPPTYPAEAINFQGTWMSELGDSTHTWDVIAGVIGGYGWKARFVGNDGHLVGTAGSAYSTGLGHNQFNFFGGVNYGWANYHPADVKIYNYGCFKCHTTGGDTAGTWLASVPGLGTFNEGGVGCEACHGPGSIHVGAPDTTNIDRVYEYAHLDNSLGGLQIDGSVVTPNPAGDDVNFLCGTCHNRDYIDSINVKGGFIKHHEQWDEFVTTKHYSIANMTCISCHDPHKRVIWGGTGITTACASCHAVQAATINHLGTQNCIDCHMPFAAKSAVERGSSGYKGDIHSHLFVINTDTSSMFNAAGTYVKDDATRSAALSPHFACLGCHNDSPVDSILDKTISEASTAAYNMHGTQIGINDMQRDLTIRIYPNPTKKSSEISFTLANSETITLEIFNITGQRVYSLVEVYKSAGSHKVFWNGTNDSGVEVQSGVYFIKLATDNLSISKKLLIIK